MDQLVKNKSYTLTIESLCGNGNGVARHDGFVVFVPCTAVGDVVNAKIIKITKSYAVGKLESIITPSPDRISESCPKMASCGGCSFWHISYEAECEIKRSMINESFKRIGGLELEIEEFYGANSVSRYRNKVMYPVSADKEGRLVSGFYARSSHRIVTHEDCLIGPTVFSKIKDSVLEILSGCGIKAYDEATQNGQIRCIYMRKNAADRVLLTLVINCDSLGEQVEKALCRELTARHPEICGILTNENKSVGNSVLGKVWHTLWGEATLVDTLCDREFEIAPGAFYQVNREQTELLYNKAREFANVSEGEVLFDLYCGTGTIGIILAKKGVKLVGVEISADAVSSAEKNAKRNNVPAEFICLEANEALDTQRLKQKKPDVIVIDPPRKGCGAEAAEKICNFDAERIVYISCDPQTLARDLSTFYSNGYVAKKAVGVDLFPRTGHVETAVLLQRQNT